MITLDFDKVLAEYNLLPKLQPQMMLQGVEGQTDPLYGVGKIAAWQEDEDDFCHPIFNAPHINNIMSELEMFRTRVMSMKNGCYSWHRDWTPRVHIPIVTDPETSFFVLENSIIRMPKGQIYVVDTTKSHTAVNTSQDVRVHIVGCITMKTYERLRNEGYSTY